MKKVPSYEEVLQTEFGGRLAREPIVERALRENSLQMIQDSIGAVLGHLANFLPRDQISCAHLICVPFVENFIETQQDHKGVVVSKNRLPSLARKDGKDLGQIAEFVSYMAEDQSFADKLTPIPGFLSARQAVGFRMHWKKLALDASNDIRALGRREATRIAVVRMSASRRESDGSTPSSV